MKHMNRKLLSVLLALLMVLSLVPTIFAPKTTVAESGSIDQAIVQGGAILHCFDWSFDEIREALPDIKAAGYAAVQTSPVQPPKDYNASWNDTGGNWWKLYQPLDFCVVGENGSWLGSKADLIALCNAAQEQGIYVIVDVVANHTANITGGGYTVNGTYNVSDQVADRLQDPDGSKGLYHTSENGTNDDSRYTMTQYHLSMPDLNTGNLDVQNMVLDFLKECVDCGVDGFRFDAAKHIELPGDSGCGSDFWPYILSGVREYAGANNLYIYGESLSGSGSDAWVNEFITYMGLTDSQAGNTARGAVVDQNAGLLAVSDYTRGNSPKDYVIWAESHDTYEDGGSTGVSSAKIVKTWGIVGARADSTALFLARPNERMGVASSDTAWKSPAVAAVNAFKNHYDGKGEWMSYDQDAKITWIERGTSGGDAGVSIVRLEGAGWVDLEAHLMSDGVYKDSVTGNTFGVQNGRIFGNVGPTGVAVVYETTTGELPTPPASTTRTLYLRPNSGWKQDGARFAVYAFGNGDHWYSMSAVDGEDGLWSAEISSSYPSVIFCRMNPATTDNNWNNKWNQTGDLTVPSDKNLFTLAEGVWDGATTTWSAYGDVGGGDDPTVTEDEGYYLAGTMTGWSVMPEFKMTRTGASTEEYMIELPLLRTSKPFHSQFKIVYSPDGVTDQTWFPSGFDNNYGDYTGEIPQSGVYTVYFRPNYDGDSDWHDGCIYAERTKFFVTVNDTDKNGTVTVDKDVAAAGETVTVTVTPNEGYELDTLVYMCETGFNTGEFDITEIDGNTFEMPAENAAVKATFVREGALADGLYLVEASDPTIENIDPALKLTMFGTDGHVFNDNITYVLTGNFGANTYQIVKVADNALVTLYDDCGHGSQPIVETTGAVETIYFEMPNDQMFSESGIGVSSLSGYYLNIGNSTVPGITADYAFTETETPGLYVLERVLYHSSIFVCELENGLCVARYPAGSYMDTTEVAKDMDGTPFAWGSFNRLVRVSFRPDGQGGDDWFHGYFLDQVLNRVMIAESEHGTVTADKSVADVGETVTLTITPDPGYELDTLTVVNDYNEAIDVTNNAFTMTIWEANVTATFKEAAAAEPSFETHSLVLDGQIGVKFYMNLDCLTEEEKAASYMTFTISGKGEVSSDPVTFDADNTNSDGTLYGFSCYVDAIQMADTITATFHYGNGQTIEKVYSIMQYYEAFKEHAGEYSVETRNLVRALVCYGYCTQQYLMEAKNLPLGYDEASYAPIELPEELEEMVASYDYATIAEIIEEDSLLFKINNMNDENIKGISFMLALDSETKMTVTFKPDPSYTGIATCRIDNANEAEMQKVRGRFVAEVPNIPAHKLGEMHLIWAYTGGNCYSQVSYESTVIDASPMSYVYLMLTRTGATENEKSCGAAIYTYWKAAQAYIGE